MGRRYLPASGFASSGPAPAPLRRGTPRAAPHSSETQTARAKQRSDERRPRGEVVCERARGASLPLSTGPREAHPSRFRIEHVCKSTAHIRVASEPPLDRGARAPAWKGPFPSSFSHRGYLVDPASSICLSQRLSHACLSTSLSKVKPRMAH